MPTFEAGQIIRVPFPYTDRSTRQRRPALVVSRGPVGRGQTLIWVVMITSAANAGWPDDIPLSESQAMTGLPAPSLIRAAKIATVEAADIEPIGRISSGLRRAVSQTVRNMIA